MRGFYIDLDELIDGVRFARPKTVFLAIATSEEPVAVGQSCGVQGSACHSDD
jgi:hypothetical protein